MQLDQALPRIASAFEAMNTVYRRLVFDEYLVVEVTADEVKLRSYSGPREDTVMSTISDETIALRNEFRDGKTPAPGEFEFTREGQGSNFDATICLGKSIFLLCNNTGKSMAEVSRDPNWVEAQGAFLNLSQAFAVDPVAG